MSDPNIEVPLRPTTPEKQRISPPPLLEMAPQLCSKEERPRLPIFQNHQGRANYRTDFSGTPEKIPTPHRTQNEDLSDVAEPSPKRRIKIKQRLETTGSHSSHAEEPTFSQKPQNIFAATVYSQITASRDASIVDLSKMPQSNLREQTLRPIKRKNFFKRHSPKTAAMSPRQSAELQVHSI